MTSIASPSPPATTVPPREPRKTGPARKTGEGPLSSRALLLQAIRERPGSTLTSLRERVGSVGWGTVYADLASLQRARKVEVRTRGRRRLVWPKGKAPEGHQVASLVILHGETARRVASRILAKPGQDYAALEAALDLEPRVLYYHLQRLLEARLISRTSKTRYEGIAPTPLLRQLLPQATPTPSTRRVPRRR